MGENILIYYLSVFFWGTVAFEPDRRCKRRDMTHRALFKHHRLACEIRLCAVRRYLQYLLPYHAVTDFQMERGMKIERSIAFRHVQKVGPQLAKRTEQYLRKTDLNKLRNSPNQSMSSGQGKGQTVLISSVAVVRSRLKFGSRKDISGSASSTVA